MPLDENSSEKWRRVQAHLRATVGEDVYTAWFSRLQLEDILETRIYCSVPTAFLKSWIEKHHLKELTSCTAHEFPQTEKVVILHRVPGKPTIPPEVPVEETSAQDGQKKSDTRDSRKRNSDSTGDGNKTGDETALTEETLPKPLPNGKISMAAVIIHTSFRYKLRRKEIISDTRVRATARVRMIGMFLAYCLTKRSLPEIGKIFGKRDHTTVLHAVRKIEKLIIEDIVFAYEVASLEAQIVNRPLLQ